MTKADVLERLRRWEGDGHPHGLLHRDAKSIIEAQAGALEAVKAYYIDANPTKLSDAYVCDLVCGALREISHG